MNKWLVGATALFAIGYLAISLIHLPGPGANEADLLRQQASRQSDTEAARLMQAAKLDLLKRVRL